MRDNCHCRECNLDGFAECPKCNEREINTELLEACKMAVPHLEERQKQTPYEIIPLIKLQQAISKATEE